MPSRRHARSLLVRGVRDERTTVALVGGVADDDGAFDDGWCQGVTALAGARSIGRYRRFPSEY